MPGLGMVRDDLAPGIRASHTGRHIIFYRETAATLVIIRILHERMDPKRHLGAGPSST